MTAISPDVPGDGAVPGGPGAEHLRHRQEAATHCPYCALQCGMLLREEQGAPGRATTGAAPAGPMSGGGGGGGAVAAGGRALPVVVSARDFPTNRGRLCQKGWTSAELLDSGERLLTPLARARRDGPLVPTTWDAALDRIAGAIERLQREHGRDAVGVFGGGGLTNEKTYALGKFARVALRTSAIDYNGRFCMSSAAAAGLRAFGLDRGLPFPLEDIAHAGAVLMVGGNAAETMPPFMQYLTRQRENGGALVVVDPRRTATARAATLHLQPTPGTDLALANGLLHIVISEGWLDRSYIAARTTGFDDLRATVAGYWPQRVERITGVPVAAQYEAARLLAEADRAMIMTARGAEQHSKGTDTVTALINLALALGLPGTPGSGYGCLTGQGNGQGGREHGQKADQLPGYRKITDPAAREHLARVWDVPAESIPGPGRSAYELLDSLGTPDGPKALLVFGSNIAVSAPRARHVTSRLRSLDLLVVADMVLSETAAMADVVLPTAQWAEEDGTMTNLEGRVLRRERLRPPPPGVRTDLEIIAGLADRIGGGEGGDGGDGDGARRRFPTEPREVFEELRRASAGGPADYAGITYERIGAADGVFWPCPDESHPGTPRMFLDRFATPDGRARFVPVEHRPVAEDLDAEHPYYLTTGRVLAHYQSGAQTRRVASLTDAAPGPFAEIHPDLALRLGIADGAAVRVTSRRGVCEVPARLTDTIRLDTIFMPFHWSGAGRANSLTIDALDPTSRMPEFKVCAVDVVPIDTLSTADASPTGDTVSTADTTPTADTVSTAGVAGAGR